MDSSAPTANPERPVPTVGWWRVALETFSMGAWQPMGNGFADGELTEAEAMASVAAAWGGRAVSAERV